MSLRTSSVSLLEDSLLHHLSSPPSTPFSANGTVPLGFGFEFEYCLQQKWQDDLERQEARLSRYGRFGMDANDARQPTPEDMREAYRRLIENELEDVHTPSPSPSPSPKSSTHPSVFHAQCIEESRPASSTLQKNDPNVQPNSAPRKRNVKQGSGRHRGKPAPTPAQTPVPTKISKRQRKKILRPLPSTHHMTTRSKSRAAVCG